ncbi:MAG: hypothetical protein Q3971_01705 [Moraxella sp.]|nr:hypothetical protein [Moraxella sp.]
MRYLPLVVLMFGVSACAMLPNPADTVSYTANTNAKPNAPTLNTNVPSVMPPTNASSATMTNVPATISANPSSVPASTSDFITVVNAFVVKSENGVETLVPVNASTPVKSGDVLEYQGLFTNTGDRVRKMDVTLSIADGLELVGGVVPQHASASVDGNRFVRMPIRVNVGGQIQNLPLAQYKALRWTIDDVGLGGTAVVKYRAKLK